MSNCILFIFEGERTEEQILKSLRNFYLNHDNPIIATAYCTDIYNLYRRLDNDPDLELFQLIKDMEINRDKLAGISRGNVSEIYLFFDYDGHAPRASDDQIKKMLNIFDEETDAGKLYLSYPMVEAIKHLKSDISFKDVVVECKSNINYKNLVHENNDGCFRGLADLQQRHWSTILSEHCKKLNYLINDQFDLPTTLTTQSEAFKIQMQKHIIPNSQVAVLSGFPVFILDYYGCAKLPELVTRR